MAGPVILSHVVPLNHVIPTLNHVSPAKAGTSRD